MINIHTHNEYGFRMACVGGHINVVKYLLNLYKINTDYNKININIYNESYFELICKNGHLNIIKYLINLHKINTDYNIINFYEDNTCFECAYESLDIINMVAPSAYYV
jgi:ankyrin repeat protein